MFWFCLVTRLAMHRAIWTSGGEMWRFTIHWCTFSPVGADRFPQEKNDKHLTVFLRFPTFTVPEEPWLRSYSCMFIYVFPHFVSLSIDNFSLFFFLLLLLYGGDPSVTRLELYRFGSGLVLSWCWGSNRTHSSTLESTAGYYPLTSALFTCAQFTLPYCTILRSET